MNANGLRFWGLTEASDWLPSLPLEYTDAGRLRLKSARVAVAPTENQAVAQSKLQIVPQARDTLGSRAYVASDGQIMATGAVPGKISIYSPPSNQKVTDLALGFDGILYIAVGGNLLLQDKRGRWADTTLTFENFKVQRLTPDPAGGVWILNQEGTQLGRVQGTPLPDAPRPEVAAGVMRPVEENPDPPRLSLLMDLPQGEKFVAIAGSPGGRVCLLSWAAQAAQLRILTKEQNVGAPQTLLAGEIGQTKPPIQFPYSIAFLDENHVAVLVTNLQEILVYALEDAPELIPTGDIYPLISHTGEPFMHGLDLPAQYPTQSGSSAVYPLSYRSFVSNASTYNQRTIDSAKRQTEWHRIYLEALIPTHCGIKVYLAASDTEIRTDAANPGDKLEWFEHRFGEIFQYPPSSTIPTGVWVRNPSELPFHSGLLSQCKPEPNKGGLFTVLVQRAGKSVRALRGRYLAVRVEFIGDGLTTPELASLRVYASRFSLVKNYLPELYQETVFPPDSEQGVANGPAKSTAADFLERFVDNFEGVLTELEDRVAASYLLTRAESTYDDALPWLASWIGLSYDPTFPKDRRREMLRAARGLFERHGTLAGLRKALDVATGGMASNGSVIVVEEFRLRRTFATILGANLENDSDPLLPGFSRSANSYVGDTLFLGDEHRKEFLALFGPQVFQGMSAAEIAQAKQAIFDFYERLAHRITVLVQKEVSTQDFGLISRVVQLEKPAHVVASVQRATYPFMVGIASLLGVDTYLRNKPEPNPVRVDVSRIGGYDVIRQTPSLDPRFEGGNLNASQAFTAAGSARVEMLSAVRRAQETAKPIAKITAPKSVRPGDVIRLDASASEPPLGSKIVKYRWTLMK
jgi:phage tail-like protein